MCEHKRKVSNRAWGTRKGFPEGMRFEWRSEKVGGSGPGERKKSTFQTEGAEFTKSLRPRGPSVLEGLNRAGQVHGAVWWDIIRFAF